MERFFNVVFKVCVCFVFVVLWCEFKIMYEV